ncbi:MAG: hypothetical protein U1D99_05715 [Candidatus Omnitrophota bacterium]|nr:hypothetical protein [Candidatus Omnitrophota bacterium]
MQPAKAQSTVEFLIIFAMLIAAAVVLTLGTTPASFKYNYGNMLLHQAAVMESSTARLNNVSIEIGIEQ